MTSAGNRENRESTTVTTDLGTATSSGNGTAAPGKPAGRYAIAVLGKAFDLIDLLDRRDGLTLTQISADSGMSKPTALRILANLEERGYVERDAAGRYHLGMRLLQLGTRITHELDLRTVAHPVLKQLNAECSETVNLAVPSAAGVVYIDIIESAQGLRMAATIGAVDDVHSTAVGKAMAAQWSEAALDEMLAHRPLTPKTGKTITDVAHLKRDLAVVRQRGYAIDDEENESSARCVGAPLFDHRGACVGAISISGPATRMPHERINELGQRIVQAARSISQQLGADGAWP